VHNAADNLFRLYIDYLRRIILNSREVVKNSIFVLAVSLFLVGCHHGYDTAPDIVAPVITGPSAITFAAEDASGAVSQDAVISGFLDSIVATDSADGPVAVSNNAPDFFPLGDTTVYFIATDSSGNRATFAVVVTVVDSAAPILLIPDDITLYTSQDNGVEATRSEIEAFLNAVTASDNVDISVDVTNNAPTDFFPYGETLVEFTATDAQGNVATGTGVVTVILEVVLTDFNPDTQVGQIHRLPAFIDNEVLSTDLSVEPLNLLNLKNALVEGDFHTPTLNSRLYNLPVGSGTETAFISMFDGLDSVRSPGERHVMVELVFDWTSDGEQLDIVVPAQVMDILYTNQIDTVINLTTENYVLNTFSVTREGIIYPEILDDAFLRALAKFTDLPLDELLDAGTYTFQVESSLPLIFVDGSTVTQIDAIVKIEADQ
jgi:hypothetical protein